MDWYCISVDFAVAQNTSRMIYMHPNGANVWPDVLQDLLAYAKTQGTQRFNWYTMTRLADFMTAASPFQTRAHIEPYVPETPAAPVLQR